MTRSLSRAEAVRRAALLEVTSYDVDLDLAEADTFRSRSTVRFSCREPGADTFVELADALDVRATLNGRPVERGAYDGDRIRLEGLLDDNELSVAATLPCVTSGDGMHRYVDPADGATYLTAFCGSDLAHRVFACFDQPDLKATVSLTVTAPEAWTVLANGAPLAAGGEPVRRRFATTPPISTYLFVVSAGPWHSVTWQHAGLPFGWHARRSTAAALDRDVAELRRVTEACFDHYTGVFDQPYAFDSYDQVLAPGLNWGALETPGCVTFRAELLHPDGASDAEREQRAMIIAHEMAHMWFGDLVTLRWWEDIWLNESFADYMGFEVAGTVAGFPTTWTGFTLTRELQGYAADQRRSTHPVAPLPESVVDTDAGFANADLITYAKGNAVLRQLVTWLGQPTFTRGVNRFLTAHRFGNADLGDFLDALDAVTDRDVRGWAEAWLRSTGFDTLEVRRDGDVPVLTRSGSRPHRVDVAAYAPTATGLVRSHQRTLDLGDQEVRLDDWAGLAVLPNAQDRTFARIRTDPQSWALLSSRVGSLSDGQERSVVWATALDLVREAELDPAALFRLVGDQLPHEQLPAVWEAVTEQARTVVLPRHLPVDRVPAAREVLAGLGTVTAGAVPALRLAATRLVASCSADVDLLHRWLEDGWTGAEVEVDAGLRWRVLNRLAELGAVDLARIDAEAAEDRSARGETWAVRSLAALPSVRAKERAWSLLSSDGVDNRVFRAALDGLWVPEQAELLAPYVERYLAEAPGWAQARGQGFSSSIGHAFPSYAVDPSTLDQLGRALDGDVPTVLRRAWADRLDDLVADLVVRSHWA